MIQLRVTKLTVPACDEQPCSDTGHWTLQLEEHISCAVQYT